MSRLPRVGVLLVIAAAAVAVGPGCSTSPPRTETVVDASATKGAAAPPRVASPVEPTDDPPEAVATASDDVSRLFACLEFSHVDLLAETDKNDIEAVAARLGELRGGRPICFELVRRILRGYGPIIAAFEAEWSFYTTYFALTAEVFADHNADTSCGHLAQTVEASKDAVRKARKYLKWLNRELAANEKGKHAYLDRMSAAATEKVTGLTVAASQLRDQYRSQCK